MEDHVFDSFLEHCKEFPEASTGLEIFNYTDPAYNSCKEYDLLSKNLSEFLYRRGAFKPPVPLGKSVKCIGGLRLIIQTHESHFDTPTSRAISLPKQLYREMFNAFHLNKRSVDAGSIVGSSFWAAEDGTDGDSYLALTHRQSFEDDNGEPQVCELILSYSFQTKLTCGYLRGSPTSNLSEIVAQMRALPQQMLHPISLPVLLASYQLTPRKTQSYYDARARLEQLEYNVAQCQEADSSSKMMLLATPCDMDALVREMAGCYRDTTSNSTQDYGAVLEGIEEALDTFWDMCSVFDVNETTDKEDSSREAIEKIHRKLVSTVHFFAMQLEGLENFVAVTQSRLKVLRKMIKTIISQKHMKLVDKLAAERRNGGFIDQNWNKTPGTKLPAVFGPGYLPIFVFVGVLSFGFLAIKLLSLLLNQLLSVPIGLRGEGDPQGKYEGPSMRRVDVFVYILSLVPMAVFVTLLYKSGKRKGATIKEWDMKESQDGSKEVSLPTNGELQ